MSPSADTLEDRVEKLERIVGQAIAKAEQHPVGRKILEILGLKQ